MISFNCVKNRDNLFKTFSIYLSVCFSGTADHESDTEQARPSEAFVQRLCQEVDFGRRIGRTGTGNRRNHRRRLKTQIRKFRRNRSTD